MDSVIDAALAAKLQLLFPPSDDSFLAFPLAGAAFTRDELELFDSGGDAEQVRQRGANKAQFSRLLNQIPADSEIYEPLGQLLWDEYERVVERSEVAESVLTGGERRRLEEARAYLEDTKEIEGLGTTTVYSPQVVAYYQHKEAWEDAQRVYLDEKISVESSDDPQVRQAWEESREAELGALRDRALNDWRTLGFKDQVEEAQAVVASLGSRSPEVLRQSLLSEFEACIEPDLVTNDPNGVLSTFFSPSDIFDPDVPWETLRLTKQEVADLHAQAPERMRSSDVSALEDIEEVTIEYADVTVMRPWFDWSWLHMRSWRLPKDDDAPVSDGERPRSGRIPAVIGSMIVARRVKVARRAQASEGTSTTGWTATLPIAALARAKVLQESTANVPRVRPVPQAAIARPGRAVTVEDNRRFVRAKEQGLTIQRRGAATIRDDLRTTAVRMPVLSSTVLASGIAATRVKVRDHRRGGAQKPAVVRDHRRGRDRGGSRVPARRSRGDDERPSTPEVEEVDLDCIVVLAYRCRRTPQAPSPDPSLPWSDGPQEEDTPAPGAQPFPLPDRHRFRQESGKRNHNGRGSDDDRALVRSIQRRLTELGHQLDVDGIYGGQTAGAVRAFQQSRGLEVDGIVGPNTWAALWSG